MSILISLRSSYTLESIYVDALKQLDALKADRRLSEDDFKIVTTTTSPAEILDLVNKSILKNALAEPTVKKRIVEVVEPLLLRLERFGAVIDMIVQSTPQIFGLNLVGLVWGSIMYLMVVSAKCFLLRN